MLSKTEAEELVRKELRKMETVECPFAIDDSQTMEKAFGWIFFYNSKRYLQTGELIYRLAGNGPVFVNKAAGTISVTGTNKPVHLLIEEYERQTREKTNGAD